MTNQEAYLACIELCRTKNWMAAYWELMEDFYDPAVDYIGLYDKWSKDESV